MFNRNISSFTVVAVALAAIAVIGLISIPNDTQAQDSKAITGVSVDNSTRGQITVDWNDVANAADYRVGWAESEAPWTSWRDKTGNAYPSDSSYTVTGLDDDTTYKIRIKSRFGKPVKARNSGPWKTTSGTTASAPSENGNTSDDRTTVVPQQQPEPTPPQSAEQQEDPYNPTEVRNLRAGSASDHDTLVLTFDRPSHADWDTDSGDLGYKIKFYDGRSTTYIEVLPTDSLKWPSNQNTHSYTFDVEPEHGYAISMQATRYDGTGAERELVRGFWTLALIYNAPEDLTIEEPPPNPPQYPSIRLQNAPTDSDPDRHFNCNNRKSSIGNLCYATYRVSLPDVLAWINRNGKSRDDYEYFYTVRNVTTNQNINTASFGKDLPNGEIWLPPGHYHVRVGFKTVSGISDSFTSSLSSARSVSLRSPSRTSKGHVPSNFVDVDTITTRRIDDDGGIEVSWTKPSAVVSSSASTAGWEITSYRVGNVGTISTRNNRGPRCGASNFGQPVQVSYRDYGKTTFTTRIPGGWHTAKIAVQPNNPRGGGNCTTVTLEPPEIDFSVFEIRQDLPDYRPGTYRPLRSSVWACAHPTATNICAREYVVSNYKLEGWARAAGDSSLAQILYQAFSNNGQVTFTPNTLAYNLPATIAVPPGTWDFRIIPKVNGVNSEVEFTPQDVTVDLPNYADFGHEPGSPINLRSTTSGNTSTLLWNERRSHPIYSDTAGNGGWPVTEFRIYDMTDGGSCSGGDSNDNFLTTVAGGYENPVDDVISHEDYEVEVPSGSGKIYGISAVNLRGESSCATIQLSN